MKERAKKLMALMKFPATIIESYNQDKVLFSYNNQILELPEDIRLEKEKIENEYDIVVYHVLKTHTGFGTCYELLFISPHEEDEDEEINFAKRHTPFAYVINTDERMFSEFGSIRIKIDSDHIKRIG